MYCLIHVFSWLVINTIIIHSAWEMQNIKIQNYRVLKETCRREFVKFEL